jgi:hypothetical protein
MGTGKSSPFMAVDRDGKVVDGWEPKCVSVFARTSFYPCRQTSRRC